MRPSPLHFHIPHTGGVRIPFSKSHTAYRRGTHTVLIKTNKIKNNTLIVCILHTGEGTHTIFKIACRITGGGRIFSDFRGVWRIWIKTCFFYSPSEVCRINIFFIFSAFHNYCFCMISPCWVMCKRLFKMQNRLRT